LDFWKRTGFGGAVKRLAVLLLSFSGIAFAQWPNGYSYRATWTVQAGKVSGTVTNLVTVIADTATGLKTMANGGHVLNTCTQTLYGLTVPADFLLTTDSAGTTSVPGWQFDTYTATTGAFSIHFKTPSIAVGTVIYGWYGKSSQTTCLGGASSSVVNGAGDILMAFPNQGGTLKTNSYVTLTVTAGPTPPTATTGPNTIGAAQFAGVANSYLTLGSSGNRTSPYTVCAWINFGSHTSGSSDYVITDENISTTGVTVLIARLNSTGFMFADVTDSNLAYIAVNGTISIASGAWHQVCEELSYPTLTLYTDGAVNGTPATLTNPLSVTGLTNLVVGQPQVGAGVGDYWNGKITEITIANSALSTAYINARYNNYNSPSTFWATVYDQTFSGISASPTAVPTNQTGNVVITLVGTGTSWVSGTTTFTISGVTGVTKVTQNVISSTSATLTITTGSTNGTLTISDGTLTTTIGVGLGGVSGGCSVVSSS
jgi:hypothetical protein